MKDHCTCFPDTVFGIYIGDICKLHDRAYSYNHAEHFYHCFLNKCWADILLGWRVSRRAYRLIWLGPLMSLATLLLGGYFWRKHHGKK